MALLPVVLKYGLRAEYDSLQEKSSNVLYFLTDTGEIYRGDVNLARGSHYEGIRTIKEDGSYENDNEVFARVLSSKPAVKDDIFVIKTQIGESDKYTYTAYTYDGELWAAMDGNYNADNVIFDKDMLVTNNIGAYQMPDGVSSAVLPTAGKSLKEVLAGLLAKELQPVRVSSPVVNLTSKISNGAYKWVEVGEEVSVDYTASLSKGSYTYGPDTGITATSWSVTNGTNTLTTATGTFPAITVTDNMEYNISATANYGDGAVPVTNLGNPAANESVQIKAGSASQTISSIIGYRPFFYGIDNTTNEITSDVIRNLTNGGIYNTSKTLTLTASDDTTRFIVAYPADTLREGLTKVTIESGLSIEITSTYSKNVDVEVRGANGYTTTKPYTVWVYQPAKITPNETHKIILG